MVNNKVKNGHETKWRECGYGMYMVLMVKSCQAKRLTWFLYFYCGESPLERMLVLPPGWKLVLPPGWNASPLPLDGMLVIPPG